MKREQGKAQIERPMENDTISVGKMKDGRLLLTFAIEHESPAYGSRPKDTWVSRDSILFSRDDARWIAREILRVLGEPGP